MSVKAVVEAMIIIIIIIIIAGGGGGLSRTSKRPSSSAVVAHGSTTGRGTVTKVQLVLLLESAEESIAKTIRMILTCLRTRIERAS